MNITRSIISKFYFSLLISLAIFFILLLKIFTAQMNERMDKEIAVKVNSVIRMFSAISETVNRMEDLRRFIASISAEHDILEVAILDLSTEVIIASNRFSWHNSPYKERKEFELSAIQNVFKRKDVYQQKLNEDEVAVYLPFLINLNESSSLLTHQGCAYVRLDIKDLRLLKESAIQNVIILMSIFVLFLLIFTGVFFKFYINTPLSLLIDVIRKRASGQKGLVVPVKNHDEFGRLSSSVNEMFATINEQEASLIKSREEAEAISRMKSSFLANMSHEFRTPLNGILGFTDILVDTELQHEQREMVQTVKLCSENLLGLINDILDLSKIEANEVKLESIPFDLNQLVMDCMTLIQSKVGNKKLFLRIEMPKFSKGVLGDPTRLKQIFLNLLSNALKFTERGYVCFRIEVIEESSQSLKVRFLVEDTGIGMSKEAQGKVFEAFKQADDSTTRKYGGTGLGMSIVKNLVLLMESEICLESEVDKGTTFGFEVTLAKDDQEDTVYFEPVGGRCWIDQSILDVQPSVQSYFEDLEIQVHAFQDISELSIDVSMEGLIFIDYDVYIPLSIKRNSVVERIKELQKTKKLQVCLVTKAISAIHLHQIKKASVDFYLQWPVWFNNIHELMRTLHKKRGRHSDSGMILPPSKFSILVAEDNLINQKLIQKILKNMGHKVELAKNGLEAVKMSQQEKFDLVFMDMQMPEMDGLTATREMRKNKLEVPIVAMTANAFESDREACLEAGMNDFLTKPIKKDEIAEAIEKFAPSKGGYMVKRNFRVLVIEDEAPVRKIMVKALTNQISGVAIEEASNGIVACTKLGSFLPDLIITDLNMPQMDGREFIKFIQNEERYCHIQVLVYTAMSKDHTLVKAMENFMVNQIFFKPTPVTSVAEHAFKVLKTEALNRLIN